MKIGVVGTGYVGLVQGVIMAEFGLNVICMDVSEEKIENLKKGIIPIYEPGLKELLEKNMKAGRIEFTTDMKYSTENSEVIFIAVGTPPALDGSADLHFVLEVAKSIGQYMNGYKVVVDKSTVPVGTGKLVRETIQRELDNRNLSYEFDIVSNPEFLREGKAVGDCLKPDRVVIGTESDRAKEIMKKVYDVLFINETPFIFTNIETAEMIKYSSNAMLAVKISFINEIALLAEKVGANTQEIARAMGMDGRISPKFLHCGPGYGGSCFPKDVKALIKTAELNGYPMQVLRAVEEVNELQKSVLFDKLVKQFNDNLKDKTIALWGLAFKPETDDMREAPALVLIDKLLKAGCQIRAYDPAAMQECKRRIGDSVYYACDMYDAVLDADALMLVTEWKEFRLPSWAVIRKTMAQQIVLDGRNIYDKKEMEELGFVYSCIGK